MEDYVCCDYCGKMMRCGEEHKVGKYIVCHEHKNLTSTEIKKEFNKKRY